MDSSSPARLYCTLIGAVLVLVGILGFFYEASFATGDEIQSDDVLGLLAINGWHNLIHIAIGLVLLAAAGSAARTAALAVGLLYLVLAIWGFIESDERDPRAGPDQRRGQRAAPDPRAARARRRGRNAGDGEAEDAAGQVTEDASDQVDRHLTRPPRRAKPEEAGGTFVCG